jgi:autotransporter passenger strand-loop-strand repeat protein
VSANGTQVVFATAVSTTIDNGGIQQVAAGGAAGSTTVSSGGIQYDAGTATDTTVSAGGAQVVFGSAGNTTIDSDGTESVISGGTVSGASVASGGTLYNAGTASDTTLSDGTVEVFSGGVLNGATISSGLLELQSGATAGASTITFSGGGTLKLDAAETYGFLVAGFGIPDEIDLSAINFATANKQYSGNTLSGTLTVDDGTNSASILLLGNYTVGSFNLNPETGGGTGTVVTDPPPTGSGVITPPH